MKIRTSGRFTILMAIVACGIAMLALPQKAHAFLGMQCPFEKNELLNGALQSFSRQTGRKIVVVNSKGAVVADSCCATACSTAKGKTKGNIAVNNAATGSLYPEVKQTLADGKTRTWSGKGSNGKFMKKSITAVRNAKGQIIGAVLVTSVN